MVSAAPAQRGRRGAADELSVRWVVAQGVSLLVAWDAGGARVCEMVPRAAAHMPLALDQLVQALPPQRRENSQSFTV